MTTEKKRLMPPALNREQLATVSGDSSDSGDLSLFCSVSSIKIEELEVLEVEGYLETVEPYQFNPVVSDSSAVVLPLVLELSTAPIHLGSSIALQPPHASPLPVSLLASLSPTPQSTLLPPVPLSVSQPPVPPSALQIFIGYSLTLD